MRLRETGLHGLRRALRREERELLEGMKSLEEPTRDEMLHHHEEGHELRCGGQRSPSFSCGRWFDKITGISRSAHFARLRSLVTLVSPTPSSVSLPRRPPELERNLAWHDPRRSMLPARLGLTNPGIRWSQVTKARSLPNSFSSGHCGSGRQRAPWHETPARYPRLAFLRRTLVRSALCGKRAGQSRDRRARPSTIS